MSTQHLGEHLQDSWKTILGDYQMSLTERMPTVCKAVIKAKGKHTLSRFWFLNNCGRVGKLVLARVALDKNFCQVKYSYHFAD